MRSTSCAQEAKYEACNHRQACWTVVRSTSCTQEAKYEATRSKNDATNEFFRSRILATDKIGAVYLTTPDSVERGY